MNTTWTFEDGQLWATCADGRRTPTWTAAPPLGLLVDLLNVSSGLSALLLAGWLGEL